MRVALDRAWCPHTLADADAHTCPPVHPCPPPRFKLDEGVLFKGSALHASLAVEFLRSRQQQQQAAKGAAKGKEEL